MPKDPVEKAAHIARISASCKANPRHRSKRQSGRDNPNFKGGAWLDKHGYRMIRLNGKDVPEHRAVMAKMIGRELYEHETVHHKNGQRADNREFNLELWSTRNPKGQRITDKISWAEEFLPMYGRMVSKPPADSMWVSGLLYC